MSLLHPLCSPQPWRPPAAATRRRRSYPPFVLIFLDLLVVRRVHYDQPPDELGGYQGLPGRSAQARRCTADLTRHGKRSGRACTTRPNLAETHPP